MSAEDKTHLAPGFRLDRYELLCPLGVGGMASVWVARLVAKHGFEKLVAIKTILPNYARDENFRQMFLDEARIAARIQNPNVAQILDLGDQHGVLYIVMEWVEGEALSKLAKMVQEHKTKFPPGIAARILVDVCAGLHAAHELRDRSGANLEIVHRDVSPHNILVGVQGSSKVIDFGIAKARDRAAGDTRTGSFKGKVKYMAPEQAVAPKSTDRRADIWAVGAVLYTLLGERSPYESDNDMATLVRLAQQKEADPLPPEVPDAIRNVVARALAWNPDDRYPTAMDLGNALEKAMDEARIETTSADVAAFSAHHLADRNEVRQKAIGIGLAAAEERSRVAQLLKPEEESASHRISRAPIKAVDVTDFAVSSSDRPTTALNMPSSQPGTSPTLGAAGTMTFNSPGASRRRGIVVLAGAAVLALLGVVAIVRFSGQKEPAAAARIAASPAESATPARALPPPVPPSTANAPAAIELDAPAATTAAPSAPAQASSPPSNAGPTRRRPASPPASTSRTQPPASSPSPTKHRVEYGF